MDFKELHLLTSVLKQTDFMANLWVSMMDCKYSSQLAWKLLPVLYSITKSRCLSMDCITETIQHQFKLLLLKEMGYCRLDFMAHKLENKDLQDCFVHLLDKLETTTA
jgi:hypothetical protein